MTNHLQRERTFNHRFGTTWRSDPESKPHSRARFVHRLIVICLLLLVPDAGSVVRGQELYPLIVNGFEDVNGIFESVGIVGSQFYGIGYCSGTLISPTHVLTAAHCVEPMIGPEDGTFQIGGQIYTTTRVFVHPQYASQGVLNDVAILELSEPVINVQPSAIFRGIPLAGDVLTIVGFGGQGEPAQGSDGTFGVRLYGFITIDRVTDALVIWDYDDPSESNTAAGDSGGPGFLDIDGVLYVASITSAGTTSTGELGDTSFNTRVDSFAPWIDSVVEAWDDGTDDGTDGGTDDDIDNGTDEGTDNEVDEGPDGGADDDVNDGTDDQFACPAGMAARPQGYRRPPRRGHRKGYGRRPGSRRPPTLVSGKRPPRYVQSVAPMISSSQVRSPREAYTAIGPSRTRLGRRARLNVLAGLRPPARSVALRRPTSETRASASSIESKD